MTALSASATFVDILRMHGQPSVCYRGWSENEQIILGVTGSVQGDRQPGFLVCKEAGQAAIDFCGAGLNGIANQGQSRVEHWQFYPAPSANVQFLGSPNFPQQYQCVGYGSITWAFHLDTLTYTSGCNVVDPSKLQYAPCDVFLDLGTESVLPLYASYGKADACGVFGATVVSVLDGNPQPGFVVCEGDLSLDAGAFMKSCGLAPGQDALMTSRWRFIPLPVASGPVDNATFDTVAGTACITVGAQSFTFTVATSAVAAGCAGAGVATATP